MEFRQLYGRYKHINKSVEHVKRYALVKRRIGERGRLEMRSGYKV